MHSLDPPVGILNEHIEEGATVRLQTLLREVVMDDACHLRSGLLAKGFSDRSDLVDAYGIICNCSDVNFDDLAVIELHLHDTARQEMLHDRATSSLVRIADGDIDGEARFIYALGEDLLVHADDHGAVRRTVRLGATVRMTEHGISSELFPRTLKMILTMFALTSFIARSKFIKSQNEQL